MEESRQFLLSVVSALVDNPDAVSVEARTDEMGVLLTLHVAKEDMGKLIGRNGSTAKALREIVRVAGMRQQARIHVKIAEPEGSEFTPPENQQTERGDMSI